MKTQCLIFNKPISSAEKLLVAYMVFEIFWSFFTGFGFWYGGLIGRLLGAKFSLLSQIGLWMTFVFVGIISPTVASKRNVRYAISYVAISIFVWISTFINSGYTENSLLVYTFNGAVLISMRDDLKLRCFDIFIRSLSIFLVPAMIEYVVYQLTGFGFFTAEGIQRGTYDLYCDQLLFNFIYTNYPIQRFQSLTEEPGLMGTCCGFLIFALKGKQIYKIQYIIFIIAGLLSFSFAYYLMLIGHIISSGKGRYVFLFIIIGFVFYISFRDSIETLLLIRVENKDDSDEIFLRNSYELDMAVQNAWKTGDLWLGHAVQVGEGNAGYKVWLWMYGVLSLVFYFLFHLKIFIDKIRSYKSQLFPCILFFIVFWASFYQRQYILNLDYLIILLLIPIINGSIFMQQVAISKPSLFKFPFSQRFQRENNIRIIKGLK